MSTFRFGSNRLDPDAPRDGKFSLNDLREYIGGHWFRTYDTLKRLGWKIPPCYLFSREEIYQFLLFHYAHIGRKWMRGKEFQSQLPDPEFLPMEEDPDDIMPAQPRHPNPVGFELPSGRSFSRLKRAYSPTGPSPRRPAGSSTSDLPSEDPSPAADPGTPPPQ